MKKITQVSSWCLKAAAGISLILFVFLFIQYGWDPKYLFLVGGGVLCLLLLRLAPVPRVSITLIVLSTLAALLGSNLVLGLRQYVDGEFPRSHWKEIRANAQHIPVLAQAAQRLGQPFDVRSRLEVMLDLRHRGIEAWPTISAPLLFAHSPAAYDEPIIKIDGEPVLPFGGISNAVTVYCNESGERIVFQTDEHGFANPPGLWATPDVQVAIVGDSFAHGACVHPDQSFPALIRQAVPTTLNLGNDGMGPLSELAIVKEYLPPIRPKVVVWTYFERNDFWDLAKERESFLRNYLRRGYHQDLISKQPQIDEALKSYVYSVINAGSPRATADAIARAVTHHLSHWSSMERLLKLSYLWETLAGLASGPSQAQADEQPEGYNRGAATKENVDLFRQILQEARDAVQGWGGQLIFVYLPEFDRYAVPNFLDPNRDIVFQTVQTLQIPMIDLDRSFRAHGDVLSLFPFRQPAHYTREGYRIVADEILSYLQSIGIATHATASNS